MYKSKLTPDRNRGNQQPSKLFSTPTRAIGLPRKVSNFQSPISSTPLNSPQLPRNKSNFVSPLKTSGVSTPQKRKILNPKGDESVNNIERGKQIGLPRKLSNFVSPVKNCSFTPSQTSIKVAKHSPVKASLFTPNPTSIVQAIEFLNGNPEIRQIKRLKLSDECEQKRVPTIELHELSLEEIDVEIEESKKRIEVLEQKLLTEKPFEEKENLEVVIKTWLEGCQGALQDLFDTLKGVNDNLTMEQLIDSLGITSELVNYNIYDENFVTRV